MMGQTSQVKWIDLTGKKLNTPTETVVKMR